jgi:hypothetical protein
MCGGTGIRIGCPGFPMDSHNLLFGYRFLSCSDPKLNLGSKPSHKRSFLRHVSVQS